MVRLERILLQVLVAISVYLVISISSVSAIEITIYRQIMSGGSTRVTGEKETATLDTGSLIDKTFEFIHDPADYQWQNVQVKIEVIGKDPLYPIKKIYLFRCKDSSPLECVDYEPVEADSFLSGERGTFPWNDVSRGTTANFLTLVKFSHNGEEFWTGFWDEGKKEGVQDFRHNTYDLSKIDIYAVPGIEPAWVKDFIHKYHIIPSNWMEWAALGTVNGNHVSEIYELVANSSDMNVPYFEKYRPSTSRVETVTKDYLFAFARGSIANPVTFFSNPLPECGDGACDVGENPEDCCLDCGCSDPSDECTANNDYPNGFCHLCGDGVEDPVENSTNCCIDSGCPAGLDCDVGMNIPYGKCVAPQCGNGVCEPSEDSGTCPVDCWSTPGKRCDDVYGPGYYFSQELQDCMLSECGARGCEPGEDSTNCCLDCAGCPAGQYCNTDTIPSGVCTTPTCGNGKCETGEDYTNCCTDCTDCPADPYTGQLQVCTQNVCHLCGNGNIESPVETPETCCQDTGCTDGYCSVGGSCKDETAMGFQVTILPQTVDCTQGGEVDIRFTPTNGPAFFNSFESISYTFENSRYMLTQCVQQGDIYMCKLPITGPETFPGCFDLGMKSVDFSVLFTYFEDRSDKDSNNIRYREVFVPFNFEVTKARQRTCNKNGACEPGIGETHDFCCWDCTCEGGLICTASGCRDEEVITLAVNPEDLPASHNIDCSPKSGMQPTGDFTIRAHVQNVPESAYGRFDVLNWKLEYQGTVYTAQNIPGFSCTELTTEYGHHTGDVECSIPVSMFPACPNPPPADLKLTLNILGGGLLNHYAPYEGKAVSADFSLDYVQGLPLCGNMEPNPELGETFDNCCRDMGCPSNDVCTVYSGCVDESEIDLDVTVTPESIDCSREPETERGKKKVIILAEAVKKPYSPETSGLEFGDAYIDDSRIEEMGGICEPVVNSTAYSVYGWRCSVPVDDFNPFCWNSGTYESEFETTITWHDRNGDRKTKRVVKPISFEVETPRVRQCLPDGIQDPELGEIIDQCCPDAGCSADGVCTKDITCVGEGNISLVVDDVSPDSLDCMADDEKVTVSVHVENMPYYNQYTEWFMEYAGNTFTEQYFTCSPTMLLGGIESSNSYRCEMPVYYFPACAEEGVHELNLTARMVYSDYRGQLFQKELETGFNVNVGVAGLPNCGTNGRCDKELGETPENCCMDCGCRNETEVCSVDRSCYAEDDIIMTIEPLTVNTNCQLSPGEIDEFDIKDYMCNFQDPIDMVARLNHKPWNSQPTTTSYVWDRGKSYHDVLQTGEGTADGWKLSLQPNPDGSYIVKPFAGNRKTTKHTVGNVTLSIVIPSVGDSYDRVIKVESADLVSVFVTEEKNDDLLDTERALKAAKDAAEKALKQVCTLLTIIGICVMCSLMAGGVQNQAADSKSGTVTYDDGKTMKTYEYRNGRWYEAGDDPAKYVTDNFKSDSYYDVKGKYYHVYDVGDKTYAIRNDRFYEMITVDSVSDAISQDPDAIVLPKGDGNYMYLSEKSAEISAEIANEYKLVTTGGKPPIEDSELIGKLDDRRKAEREKYLESLKAPPTASKMGAVTHIFTTLTSSMVDMNFVGSTIAGGLSGLLFLWVMKDMECEEKYQNAVKTGMAVCGAMTIMGGFSGAIARFMQTLAKICNLLSAALQLLMLANDLRSMSLDHQSCMIQAETELSKRPAEEEKEKPGARAQRMSDYYRKLASCYRDLGGATMDHLSKWGDFSRQMSQAPVPLTAAAVDVDPNFGTSLAPGESFTIDYNFPARMNGQVLVAMDYYWIDEDGARIGSPATESWPIRGSMEDGSVTCNVYDTDGYDDDEAIYKLECKDGREGRFSKDIVVTGCPSFVRGDDPTKKKQVCSDAKLSAKVRIEWLPCEPGGYCVGYYDLVPVKKN